MGYPGKKFSYSWKTIFVYIFWVCLCLALFSCISFGKSKPVTLVNDNQEEASLFEKFLYDQVDERLMNDSRFQRILDMHHHVIENRQSAQEKIAQIISLKAELDLLLEACSYPEVATPYILSTTIAEPVDSAYYQKSIYRCEHYLTDSEIAMANSRNHLDYLGHLQREIQRILNMAGRECEMRGMAEEYRYMLLKSVAVYMQQVDRQDALYEQWIMDLEQFAMDYSACMKKNR